MRNALTIVALVAAVFVAGVKFTNFNLFGGYRLGLLDLNKNNNIVTKANGLFVGVGFTL